MLPESLTKLRKLFVLSVDSTSLTALPAKISELTNLGILRVGRNKIDVLPASLGLCSGLVELSAPNTDIVALPDSVSKLTDLQDLVLDGSLLETVPEWIGALTNLRTLSLGNVQAVAALPASVSALVKLTLLQLSGTNITAVPAGVGALASLQELSVGNTPIGDLPEAIGDCSELTALQIWGTGIARLPDSIGSLTNLQVLRMQNTLISVLPSSVSALTNLHELRAGDTPLQALPDGLGAWAALAVLLVGSTQITALPESISNCRNLESLDVSATKLDSLPDSFGNFSSLRLLLIDECDLRELPASLCLVKITELDVSNNDLTEMPECLSQMKTLQSLVVDDNRIGVLPDLTQLDDLIYFSASNNRLVELPPMPAKLQTLLVSHNKLIRFDVSNTPALRDVDLSDNLLKEDAPFGVRDLLVSLPLLLKLSVARNLLECTAFTCDDGTTLTLRTRGVSLDLSSNMYSNIEVVSAPRLETLNLSACRYLGKLVFTGSPRVLDTMYIDYTLLSALPQLQNVSLRVLSAKNTQIEKIDQLAHQLGIKELTFDFAALPGFPDWSFDRRDVQISALPYCERGSVRVTEAGTGKEICKTCDAGSYSLLGGVNATCISDGCGIDRECLGGSSVVPRRGYWRGPPYFRTLVGIGYTVGDECSAKGNSSSARCMVSTPLSKLGEFAVQENTGHTLVYPCPNEDACIVNGTVGSAVPLYPLCALGYHGPLCSLCDDTYVWSEGHICTQCPPDPARFVSLGLFGCVVASLLISLVVGYMLLAPLRRSSDSKPIASPSPKTNLKRARRAVTRCSVRARVAFAKAQAWYELRFPKKKREQFFGHLKLARHMGKSLITFLQVIGSIGNSQQPVFPPEFHSMSGIMKFAKVSVDVPTVACAIAQSGMRYDFYSRHLLYTVGPLVLMLIIALPSLGARAWRLPKPVIEQLDDRRTRVALMFVFLLYPMVSQIALAGLFCKQTGALYLLAYDSRVDCNSPEYRTYRIFAFAMVAVWPIGCPLFLLLLMRSYGVPQLAAKKMRKAEIKAFVQHSLARADALQRVPVAEHGRTLARMPFHSSVEILVGEHADDLDDTAEGHWLDGSIDQLGDLSFGQLLRLGRSNCVKAYLTLYKKALA